METIIVHIILLSCLAFVNVKGNWHNIHHQKVSNNQEIKWRKFRNLNGHYDVMLVMFLENPSEKSEVILSVGKGDTLRKNYTASVETFDDLTELLIHQTIMIGRGEGVRIFYKGNDRLLIKRLPQSYILLTKVRM